MRTDGARTSDDLRTHNQARLLRAVHDTGATLTRAELTRDLGLARGTASVLVAELTEAALLAETPAPRPTRGRPTGLPGPHPDGPVALTVDLREDSWTVAAGELGGELTVEDERAHGGDPRAVFGALRRVLAGLLDAYGSRVIGIGLSLAGPIRANGLVHISHLGWTDVDPAALLGLGPVPLLLGNDASLAGLAEARRGGLRGMTVALHLHVDFDIGGALLVDGRPLEGARGTAGEFGHMPFGTTDEPVVRKALVPKSREHESLAYKSFAHERCMCGARDCWSLRVGTNALLRAFGLPVGRGTGRQAAEEILVRAETDGGPALQAAATTAHAFGAGIAALVNAHDPAVVTVSGLAPRILRLAEARLREAYLAGLMEIHRDDPPPIRPSEVGGRGPLVGAMELVFDAFLTPNRVAGWMSAA